MSTARASDMLIAIWSFCEPEDREAFVSYLAISGHLDKIESPSPDGVNPHGEPVAADANTGGDHVDHDNPNAFSIAGAPSPTAPAPSAGANDAAGEINSPERAQGSAAVSRVGGVSDVQGKTEPPTSAPAESVSDKISATISNPQEPTSSPVTADMGEADTSSHPASPAPFINPRCQKPDTCKWAHSMASCSPCNDAWARARVSA